MVPNHGGDPLGSILGPMGSHWVNKNGSKPPNITMPPNSNFRLSRGHRFFPKNGSYGYGAKSRWGPPRVHLGASGVPLGKKTGSNSKKLSCLKMRIFEYPAVIDFFPKNGSYGYVAKSQWGTPRFHLEASGDPLGKKMGQNRKKLPCPKYRIFHYPAVIGFSQKLEVTVMAPNHGGDPLGSILGQMGCLWVEKMSQNRKKLPCPKIRIFDYPAVIDFSQKMEVTVMAPNHGGAPLGSILGPVGSHWVKKRIKTVKNYHASKCKFSITPRSSIFFQKIEVTVMAPSHGGDTIESILGPMGSHWVQKMGQNLKKLPCPKIRIFDYTAVFGFSQKMEFTVMAPNHSGDSLGSILGPMGSHWVQKNGPKQ